MTDLDDVLERLAPLVEWVVFRFRRIVLGLVGGILCCLIVIRGWGWLNAAGRSPLLGTVSVAGRPVTFGTVTVMAADGSVFMAAIRPDGSYRLPHVPPGPIRVAVSSPEPRSVFQKAVDASPPTAPSPGRAEASRGRQPNPVKPADESGGVTIALRVDTPPPSTQSATLSAHDGWFRIPGRYADPARSGLGATVAPEGSTLDLRLEGGADDAR